MKEEKTNFNEDSILNEKSLIENKIDYDKYYLVNDNALYKILIWKKKSKTDIKIVFNYKSGDYTDNFTFNNIINLTKIKFDTIDKAYEYLINIFEECNVRIKEITEKSKTIKLCLKKNDKEFDITLNKHVQ